MNLLKRMPFGSNRQASKQQQDRVRATEALNNYDGETLRHLYDAVQREKHSRDFNAVHAMNIARYYGLWLNWTERYAEAESVWRYATAVSKEVSSEQLECFYQLALCLLGLNRLEEAERDGIEPLDEMLPRLGEEGLRNYISALIAHWRFQFVREAEIRIEDIVRNASLEFGEQEKRANDYYLRLHTALAYANGSRFRDALEYCQAASQFASNDAQQAQVYEYEGIWAGYLGERQLAKARLEEAVRLAENEPQLLERAQASLAAFLLTEGSFAGMEPLRNAAGTVESTYSAIATHYKLQGHYEKARNALDSARSLAPLDPWEKRRYLAICALIDASLELEAFYYQQPADLTVARRAVERGRVVLQRDGRYAVFFTGLDAVLSAIAGDDNYAMKLIPQVEMQLAHFEQDPNVQSGICSLLSGTYTCLKQHELARDWSERYLEIETRPVYRLVEQEKLANICDALGDTGKAESLRRTVVASGLPLMAVKAAQARLNGEELKPV